MVNADISFALIEDDLVTRVLMKRFLEKLGYSRISEAEDIGSIINKIENGRIHIVISDYYLKKSTGLELLESMRSVETTRHIPFIMVSREDRKEYVIEVLQAGADAYLVKPLSLSNFQKTLEGVLPKLESNPSNE